MHRQTATSAEGRPRVAVLTFHFHYNYGGVLQAYGMQAALRRIGYEAVFPRNVPAFCAGWIDPFAVLGLRRKGFVRAIADTLEEFPRRRAFDAFRRRFFPAAVAGPTWEEVVADPRTVACVVGSDQVWNLAWMQTWEPYYFLGSLPDESPIRRIAYGACFGSAHQRADYLRIALPLVSRFSAIGVRTATTKHLVESNTPLVTAPVVDPSLLHDFREIRGVAPFDRDFILVYGIRPESMPRGRGIALALKKATGLPIALLVPESFALESRPAIDWADRIVAWAGPPDWIESIRRCSYLVTDSFHGCLFATAVRRPFLAYPQGVSAERIVDVTSRYALGDRVIAGDSLTNAVESMLAPIDFAAVHERIRVEREASLRFLGDAIAGRPHASGL